MPPEVAIFSLYSQFPSCSFDFLLKAHIAVMQGGTGQKSEALPQALTDLTSGAVSAEQTAALQLSSLAGSPQGESARFPEVSPHLPTDHCPQSTQVLSISILGSSNGNYPAFTCSLK